MSGTVRRGWSSVILVGALAVLAPPLAYAQSAFTGTVRDTSGAVLPGVTVEVSSPVLIEGTKSDVTGAEGTYRIVDLEARHLRHHVQPGRVQDGQVRGA